MVTIRIFSPMLKINFFLRWLSSKSGVQNYLFYAIIDSQDFFLIFFVFDRLWLKNLMVAYFLRQMVAQEILHSVYHACKGA